MNIPPQFTEGEKAILGGCLVQPEKIPGVLDALDVDDFYLERNRIIFEAIQKLSVKRLPLDWVTLTETLKHGGKLETVGGPEFLTDLIDAVPSAANIQHYVEMVKKKSTLREFISFYTESIAKAYAPDADPSELTEELQKKAFDQVAAKSNGRCQIQHISEVLLDSIDFIENVHTQSMSTGFSSIDMIIKGLFRGDFNLIAGRPSMGKTAFASQVARHISKTEPVLIRSLEMPSKQLGLRYLAGSTGLNLKQLRSGLVGSSDWAAIQNAVGEFSDLGLYFDESPRATVESVYNRGRQLVVKLGRKLGLIVIDYLQLMIAKKRRDKQVTELEELTRDCKLLARELDCPVIGLSQLNRDLERRELWIGKSPNDKPMGKRPQLQDLRGSGSFEQDADVIIFLYRPGYYLEKLEDSRRSEWHGKAEAIIAKQRNGDTDIARLMWNGPTTTFHDAEIRDESKYMEAV